MGILRLALQSHYLISRVIVARKGSKLLHARHCRRDRHEATESKTGTGAHGSVRIAVKPSSQALPVNQCDIDPDCYIPVTMVTPVVVLGHTVWDPACRLVRRMLCHTILCHHH